MTHGTQLIVKAAADNYSETSSTSPASSSSDEVEIELNALIPPKTTGVNQLTTTAANDKQDSGIDGNYNSTLSMLNNPECFR